MEKSSRLLAEGLRILQLPTGGESFEKLNVYINELLVWNNTHKLVSADSREELIVRHILDSLAPFTLILQEMKTLPGDLKVLADIGSGNGMPGIPLALFIPGLKLSMIERSGRRAGFLRNAAAILNGSRMKVIDKDLNDVREKFPAVVFRGFRPLPDCFHAVSSILLSGGSIWAYKGRLETVQNELDQLPERVLSGWDVQVLPVSVPFLQEERHLCCFRKPGDNRKELQDQDVSHAAANTFK